MPLPNLGPAYDAAVRIKSLEDRLARLEASQLGQAFSATQSDGSVGMSVTQDTANAGGTALVFYQGPNTPRDPQTGQHPPLMYAGEVFVSGAPSDSAVVYFYPDGGESMTIGAGGVGIIDAAQNVVFTTDQAAGQGLGRPYIPGGFYRSDYADWVTVTGSSFATKFRAEMPKQQANLYVRAWASNDTSGATGEIQVLVNGTVWGAAQPTAFAVVEHTWGPLPVAGVHESDLTVEVQARVATGTGGVRLEPSRIEGRASS